MLHPYCVRLAGEPGPAAGLSGVEGVPVEVVEAEGLGLWVSQGEPLPPTAERLRAHDRVVRAALRTATPLPMRYGALLSDAAAAARLLGERREEFREALERVAGRVEMGARLAWREGPPAAPPREEEAPASGREYLERRRRALEGEAERRREAERAVERLEDCFRGLDLPAVRKVLPEPGVAGVVAHLVRRSDLGSYRERAERAVGELSPFTVSFTGPWAPYSFV